MIKPNPGSKEAKEQGCTCPVLDNDFGKGSYKSDGFIINLECPVHKDWVVDNRVGKEEW